MGCKLISVEKALFEEHVRLLLDHKIDAFESAEILGMSVRTLNKRVGQYLMPDKFGELPEGFLRDTTYNVRQERMKEVKPLELKDIPRFR